MGISKNRWGDDRIREIISEWDVNTREKGEIEPRNKSGRIAQFRDTRTVYSARGGRSSKESGGQSGKLKGPPFPPILKENSSSYLNWDADLDKNR